ncbi:hypothetical protein RND71_042867 [Anisodus tanguticus]|uniref:Uncharacterized protein n=1 Tax=Anisodus tanguticus TaxID=243964 RepID=A0AAE1UV30_9SOLA|nr:hypothetical protein RND71_042867 [Anisodus tanguticus]
MDGAGAGSDESQLSLSRVLMEQFVSVLVLKGFIYLKVVGVVCFMDGRLDIPQKIDPRVSAIIVDCWQRWFIDPRTSFES